jgi:hypothetical protein
MMDDLTLGHVLIALAALEAIGAIVSALNWARYRDQLRGTPLYARKRDARRLTILLAVSAAALLALACLTPLGHIALGGNG